MLIVRGVNLYPSQIEHVLLGVEGVAPHYQLVVERPERAGRDHRPLRAGEAGADREALARVAAAIRERIGVARPRRGAGPGEVPRSEGKAVRVIDKR